jgi:carbon-monoxide dehydrogenase medium subunit
MMPSQFTYEMAESVEEAIALLGSKEDAKLLAGGHSLLPLMKTRLARPATLIDIGRVKGLAGVSDGGDHLVVGALTRHHDLATSAMAREACPILSDTASQIGDPQVRHMGTIGGSVAHGDPASDLPTVLVALDATVAVQGPGGERTIAAGDFFKGFLETALAEDEIITQIRVPKTPGAGWAYLKFNTRAIDWATVGVAAVVTKNGSGISGARIALTNMGQTPIRASGVEAALAGVGADGVAAASEKAAEGTDPPSDTFASADFRRHLAQVLTQRAVAEALSK